MDNLTNIIEAIVFASGEAVPVKYIVEKLGCSLKEVNSAVSELKEKHSGNNGIHLLTFNGKLQFATNPEYKKPVSDVLTPIKEKEFTKTILECAAIIAYKQPITKPELEEIRQVSCDYAIHTLLELEKKMSQAYRKMYLHKQAEVLFEEERRINGRNYQIGHTREYIRAAYETEENLSGQIRKGMLTDFLMSDILLFQPQIH